MLSTIWASAAGSRSTSVELGIATEDFTFRQTWWRWPSRCMRGAWAASSKKSLASVRWSSWPSIQAARLRCSAGTSAKRVSNRVGTVPDASAMIAPPRRVTASPPAGRNDLRSSSGRAACKSSGAGRPGCHGPLALRHLIAGLDEVQAIVTPAVRAALAAAISAIARTAGDAVISPGSPSTI